MPIPKKLRVLLEKMPFMKRCCYVDEKGFKCGKPNTEWHHALTYSGKQMQKWFAILPLCVFHHRGDNGSIFANVKEYCEYKAIKQGIDDLKMLYPKTDWDQRLKYLSSKYSLRDEAKYD